MSNIAEPLGADQDVVSIGQVHDTKKRSSWNAACEATDGPGFQIDDERVTETLCHKAIR